MPGLTQASVRSSGVWCDYPDYRHFKGQCSAVDCFNLAPWVPDECCLKLQLPQHVKWLKGNKWVLSSRGRAALSGGEDGEVTGDLEDVERRLGRTCVMIDWIRGQRTLKRRIKFPATWLDHFAASWQGSSISHSFCRKSYKWGCVDLDLRVLDLRFGNCLSLGDRY